MKILLIGSKGFIGGYLYKYLKIKYEVISCDITNDHDDQNYVKIDSVNSDFYSLLSMHNVDVCINCSGSANVGFSFEEPEIDFCLNVLNVQKILNAILRYNRDCKFVNFSSAAVYGNPNYLPINEKHEVNPLSPYGLHKLQSELLLSGYHNYYGLKTCSLRVFSVYGPGLKKQLFWDLFQKGLKSSTVELFGSGNESRDFIHIDDLLNVIHLVIIGSDFSGEVLNVANGSQITIKTVTDLFKQFFSNNVEYIFSGNPKLGDPLNWEADISKIKKLGYKQSIDFENGVKSVVSWIKENH
jgi:dTDP-glucose 4,6-dehydratase/UDP-glucose 4-epimerase